MKMTNLKPLYDDMIKNNQMVVNFPFDYNHKAYTCLFEIISRPFKLQIASVGKNPVLLEFDVLPGFYIKSYMNSEEYRFLVSILGIKYDPNHIFKPIDFLRVLNRHIPVSCAEAKKNQNKAIRHRKDMITGNGEELFIGWYTNPPENHVRVENSEKTKKYFGSVYANYLRSINTSTKWTSKEKSRNKRKAIVDQKDE